MTEKGEMRRRGGNNTGETFFNKNKNKIKTNYPTRDYIYIYIVVVVVVVVAVCFVFRLNKIVLINLTRVNSSFSFRSCVGATGPSRLVVSASHVSH